jgi:hypothetical protein
MSKSSTYKNFKELYENRFPPELKADFEAFLIEGLSGKSYSENTKFRIASAFVAGYTAAMKRDISRRRKIIDAFDTQIDNLSNLLCQENHADH